MEDVTERQDMFVEYANREIEDEDELLEELDEMEEEIAQESDFINQDIGTGIITVNSCYKVPSHARSNEPVSATHKSGQQSQKLA